MAQSVAGASPLAKLPPRSGAVDLSQISDTQDTSVCSKKTKSWLKWGVAIVIPAAALAAGLAFVSVIAAVGVSILLIAAGVCCKLIYDRCIEQRQIDAEIAQANATNFVNAEGRRELEESESRRARSAGSSAAAPSSLQGSAKTKRGQATNSTTEYSRSHSAPATSRPSNTNSQSVDFSDPLWFTKQPLALNNPQDLRGCVIDHRAEQTQLTACYQSLYGGKFFDSVDADLARRASARKEDLACSFVDDGVTAKEYAELCTVQNVAHRLRGHALAGGADCQGWVNSMECFFRAGVFHRVIGTEVELQAHANAEKCTEKSQTCGIDFKGRAVYTSEGYSPVVGDKDSGDCMQWTQPFDSYSAFATTLAQQKSSRINSERYILQLTAKNLDGSLVNKGHYVNLVKLPSTGRYCIVDKQGVFPVLSMDGKHYTRAATAFFRKWCPDGVGYVQLFDMTRISDGEFSNQLRAADRILLNERVLTGKPVPDGLRQQCQTDAAKFSLSAETAV